MGGDNRPINWLVGFLPSTVFQLQEGGKYLIFRVSNAGQDWDSHNPMGFLLRKNSMGFWRRWWLFMAVEPKERNKNESLNPICFVGGETKITSELIWVVVSNMFYFQPYLGKIPILTIIFFRWVKPPTSDGFACFEAFDALFFR